MKHAYTFLFALCVVICMEKGVAQPYIDLINLRVISSPDAGLINHNKEKITLDYYNVSTSIPLLLKNKKDAFVISPFFEQWHFHLTNNNEHHSYYGLALPVSFLKQVNPVWSILATGIFRMNDSFTGFDMKHQAGGAVIINNKMSEKLTLKYGAYVNSEYFGLFIMPLVGIDWRINDRNNLFGVLPGNLTYQHRISYKSWWGITFRAQTNSYNQSRGSYVRIDENQTGAFVDFYLTKNIVLNAECGFSLFRKIRSGQTLPSLTGNRDQKYTNYRVNDNVYFKVALAYRLWLTK